jgi:hypothetical protein
MNISIQQFEKTTIKTQRPWTSIEDEIMVSCANSALAKKQSLKEGFRKASSKINRTPEAISYRYYNKYGSNVSESSTVRRKSSRHPQTVKNTESILFTTTKVLFQKLSQEEKIALITSSL